MELGAHISAFFGKIDDTTNIVTETTTVTGLNALSGASYLAIVSGGTWVESNVTSPASAYRKSIFPKNWAIVGWMYDSSRNAFIPPKAFNSVVFDETTCTYKPIAPVPTDGKQYTWNDALSSWQVVG
jgi:hypothetical protein